MRTKLCPIDPRQDLRGFLVWHRGVFGNTVMTMPTPPAPAPAPAPPAPAHPAPADTGKFTDPDTGESYDFPAQTPLAEMKPEQVAEYWRHKARKHETTAKARGDYDDLKAKADRLAQIEAANATDQEKAVAAARQQAADDERAKQAPRLVSAEFRAAAKGVLAPEQTTALLEDLDLTKYLDDKGEVDVAKVERKVAAFAPSKDVDRQRRLPDLGQGRREDQKLTGREAGRAEAQRRFGTPAKN